MADFLSDLEKLKALAIQARPAPPLTAESVMARLRNRKIAPLEPPAEEAPVFLFLKLGGAAAAAAALLLPFGIQAWNELDAPHSLLASMPGLTSLLGV
ncbi:MAG: hypothetical protein LBV15_00315 [Planctomycetota bacterium]|jgi:hypothetical protein|nr:hypothetical protein [Planctomycetota bacterium]